MFSMSMNILAMSEFTSGAAILDFNMAAICVTLLCISLPIGFWTENNGSLFLGKCSLARRIAIVSRQTWNAPHFANVVGPAITWRREL